MRSVLSFSAPRGVLDLMSGPRRELLNKDGILAQIRDVAESQGGDVSLRRFVELSGIAERQFIGVHWATWNEAKQDAGLGANTFFRPRVDEDEAIPEVAALVAQIGRWPTDRQLQMAKRRNARIPTKKVFRRLTADAPFLRRLRDYCEERSELTTVRPLVAEKLRDTLTPVTAAVATAGFVYMLRSGRRYKIGRTTSPTRRHREVRLDLPDRTDLVHSIETDDPTGIEAYWHKRFEDKRVRETEFFELTAADVAAFKKRTFQ
jgi:hypothetical protein